MRNIDFGTTEGPGDDLYTVAEFKEEAGPHGKYWGGICPDDGTGYWATATQYSWDHPVFSGKADPYTPQPDWATHVVWFNK